VESVLRNRRDGDGRTRVPSVCFLGVIITFLERGVKNIWGKRKANTSRTKGQRESKKMPQELVTHRVKNNSGTGGTCWKKEDCEVGGQLYQGLPWKECAKVLETPRGGEMRTL